MRRKTIEVKNILGEVNRLNQKSTCSSDTRAGWNDLLEIILRTTGNYKGFGYLLVSAVPDGCLPGTIFNEVDGRTFPDESRRFYY